LEEAKEMGRGTSEENSAKGTILKPRLETPTITPVAAATKRRNEQAMKGTFREIEATHQRLFSVRRTLST
jgi:hypothetical protein